MSNKSSDGVKPLNGRNLSGRSQVDIIGSIISTTVSGGSGTSFTNIIVTGGTLDGVSIGQTLAGPGAFSILEVGKPNGTGGRVCFFGNTVGDSACWIETVGLWRINGDLFVRDISDLGNIRITANTISSNVANTNINMSPSGTGIVNVTSGITQSSVNGNVSFNTLNGSYTSSSNTSTQTTTLNNTTNTTDGSINLNTGSSVVNYTINSISTGSTVTVGTTTPHSLVSGDRVTIASTNSTPNINGVFTVQTTPTTTSFTILKTPPVTIAGNTGTFTKRNDINLNPLDSVFVTVDTPVVFGDDSTGLIGDTSKNLTITSGLDINLTPAANINIPSNKLLTFGDDSKNITTAGTDLILNSNNSVVVNADLQVNGNVTYIDTQITQLKDPVITLGGTTPPVASDLMDRGVEYRYYTTGPKIGFFGRDTSTGLFTYIPDATNTGEIFSGALGGVQFGSASVTSVDVNGGTISNVGLLTSNNTLITGTSSVTITTPSLVLNGASTQITDSVFTIGTTSISDVKDKGFVFNYYDTSPKLGFMGWDKSSDCFKFLKDVNVVDDVVTGTNGNVCLGNTTIDNLVVTGSLLGGYAPERFSVAGGGVANPTNNTGTTFITVTSSGIATGTLPAAVVDGFEKKIMLSSRATGGVYRLACPLGRVLDPVSGTTAAKTIVFEYPGQSVHLVWDSVLSTYIPVSSNVCVE